MTSIDATMPEAAGGSGRDEPLDLERSRTHLALALEAGQMGTWEWDIVGGRVIWSPQEERLYGLEPGTFDGTVESYRARIHPDDVASSWKLVQDAIARRAEEHHVLHRIVRPDGAVRWLDSHGRFIYDADGRPTRLVGVSTDVTDRKAMEEALRHENYIRETITSNATAALFMMDADGHPTFMNPAATAMTGFTLDEIRAFPLHYAIHHHRPDGSLYPMAECPVDRALPENFDVRAHEDVFIRKDGTYFPVLCAASPIFEGGRPVGTVVEVRDVTVERRRERALRESEERYELAARATFNAIWDWNLTDGTIRWTPGVYSVFGYAEGEVAGTADWWYEHIHPDDRERVVRGIHAVIDGAEGGHGWTDEYRFRRADGSHAWVVDRGYVARDAAGRAVRMVGAMEDVTARREAEEERRRSEERFRALVDATGQYIWTNSPEGRMEGEQPGWARLTGQAPEEYAGYGWSEALHPDDRARTITAWERAVAASSLFETEHRVRRHDGEYRHFWVRGIPVLEPGGAVREWVGIHTDITERKELEERLRLLSEGIPVQVWTARPEGGLDYVSRRTMDYFGQPEAELLGDRWARFVHPDDVGRAGERWAASLASGEPYETEFRIRRHDGAWRWHLARALPLRDASGAVIGWFGSNTDIEDQKLAEQARDRALAEVRHQRARLQEIFAVAPSAIAMTEGPEHRTALANAAYREITGGRELVGRTVREAFPELAGQGFYELLDRVYATGEPYVGTEVLAHIDRDGDGTPEEYVFNFSYQPLRDVDGRIAGILTHAVEVTEQVRARQRVERLAAELERERARLSELLEQAPASISMTRGPDHVGVMQNALSRRLAGRSTVGRPMREAFPELAGHGFFELLDQVYATGRPVAADEMFVRWDRDGDGSIEAEGWFNVVYQPIRGVDGAVQGVLTHAVEVTAQVHARREVEAKAQELLRLTEALERSNHELDQFAYVTSHDLKAPLRGIANLTQWIEEDLGERVTAESAEHMRLLKGRVHRMEALIDGILTYSRAARVRARPEPVDTGALAGEVVDLLAPPAGVVEVAPGMPVVHTERVPLQQVFMNLVSNALKHGRAGTPKVRVAWREAGGAHEFSVSDNGPGIAPEYHERIWGIFQTLEARDKVEGTGIGLAVVKKIVESRGGRAWVESAPGAGATFRFTWPESA